MINNIITWIKDYIGFFITITSVIINTAFFINKIKKYLIKHKLKSVLSITKINVHLLVSENLDSNNNIVITFEQACSVSYISTLFSMANKDVEIQSLSTHSENKKDSSEICIGGPLDNILTDNYLKSYFDKFQIFVNVDKIKKYPHAHLSNINVSSDFEGFVIKDSEFSFAVVNNEIDYFVLIKLDSGDLQEERSVIMVFGYTRKGLLCGTRYLYNNYIKLYKQHKNQHFFIIGKCLIPSMKVDKTSIKDLTSIMFKSTQ